MPLSSFEDMTTVNGRGSHMQLSSASEELMDSMRKHNKFVGIWVDAASPLKEFNNESEEFLKLAYDRGIDMLTSDYPIRAN